MAVLTRDELTNRLREALASMTEALSPDFIVLFGSYAYGTPHRHSDVDLLIVLPKAPTDSFFKRIDFVQEHLPNLPDLPRLELHVMTGDEYRRELLRRNVFIAKVVCEGMPIFSQRAWEEVLREVKELMEAGESLYPHDWLEWAQTDVQRMERALAYADVYDAAYHLQQAIEKALKGLLLSRGWQLERTHDLPYLLNLAVQHEPTLQTFDDLCQRANAFIRARYPGVAQPPPTQEELTGWLPQAQQLLQIVTEALGQQL